MSVEDKSKALVTGVSGFVGANLARLLLAKGYRVRGLVRQSADLRNLPGHPGFEAFEGDLRDRAAVARATRGCTEVYHVAADYRFWARDPRELYINNVQGTENVMLAAREAGVRRVVHTSTVGTIGLSDQPRPCTETTPHDAGQFSVHYKRSKLEAEQVALRFSSEGLPVVVVNPSTPIGAWDRKPTPTGKIVVDFVNGKIPAYVATGLNFIDVMDVAEGHFQAAQKGRVGERYILGSRNLSIVEFLELVAKGCEELRVSSPRHAPSIRIPYGVAWLTGWMSTRWADRVTGREPGVALEAVKMSRRHMYFDASKAISELGLPQTPIENSVRSALQWFLDNGYFNGRSGKPAPERIVHVHPS